MAPLVNEHDFIQATNLKKFKLEKAAKPLMKLTGLKRLNELYQGLDVYQGSEFIDAAFNRLEIDIELDENGLKHIPTSGPFITISNHPFGLLDGMALLKILYTTRPDFKVMANFLLQHIDPVKDCFISVNPLEDHQNAYSSLKGMRDALGHIRDGKPLGIFPSGEVSSFKKNARTITDREWQLPALKLIQKVKVPVLPILFEGTNSAIFHLLGLLHPSLRTASLPSELLKKQHKAIKVRIGNVISVKEQAQFEDTYQYGRYLRARTYSVGLGGRQKKRLKPPQIKIQRPAKPVAEPTADSLIQREIQQLRSQDRVLCAQQQFEIFTAYAEEIPHLLTEIGRLREITFREVGEGTNQRLDLDAYDQYYLHLFLWDNEQKRLAGAYRIGEGKKIISQFGKKGMYVSSLFKVKKEMIPHFENSIELGRSFIHKDYQRNRLPLFLLWKGISTFLEKEGIYKHVMGPVSISNQYSSVSKSLMVAFLKKHYYDDELASYVKPRKRFKPKIKKVDLDDLVEGIPNDLKVMDKIIEDMEPTHFRLPVLLKKYIKQNARIIGFNIDPAFNLALDGFMIMDLKDLPEATIQGFKKV